MAGYPNVETIVAARLTTLLNAGVPAGQRIRVENEVPGNLAYTARIVVVADIGGPGDAQLTLDQVDLAVDALAGSRADARSLAEQVRAAMRLDLPGHVDPATGASLHRVATLGRPAPVPYPTNGRLHRVAAAYRLTVHTAGLS